ncbi:MAG: tetratricopeptide repeat protein [Nitrospiraceae bacterium]|nr:MAG: tetratricopeptide repeat protein [Nitrospiraceae bacterium]
MPTSTYSQINTFCLYLQKTRPNSLLDVGLGNGKMGFIARDLLDVMLGERYHRKSWKIRIDGIEVYEDYIQDHQRAIYDNIFIGDALEVIDGLGTYEIIYLGDVLEHFYKESAWQMLDKCAAHSTKYLIVSIPLGEGWVQGPEYRNPHEEHKSFWGFEEFEPFVSESSFLEFPGIGSYGTFLIRRDDFVHHRVREKANSIFERGDTKEAISWMTGSLQKETADLSSELTLVDLLLKERMIPEAVERLERASLLFPEENTVRQYLEKLKKTVH